MLDLQLVALFGMVKGGLAGGTSSLGEGFVDLGLLPSSLLSLLPVGGGDVISHPLTMLP